MAWAARPGAIRTSAFARRKSSHGAVIVECAEIDVEAVQRPGIGATGNIEGRVQGERGTVTRRCWAFLKA